MKQVTLILAALLLAACAAAPRSSKSSAYEAPPGAPYTLAGGDGSSLDEAIVIVAKSETAGVPAEYALVKQEFPGAKVKSQEEIVGKHGKYYDALTLVDQAGAEHKLYFDISSFFGKF